MLYVMELENPWLCVSVLGKSSALGQCVWESLALYQGVRESDALHLCVRIPLLCAKASGNPML